MARDLSHYVPGLGKGATVRSAGIEDATIATADLKDGAVTAAKLAADVVATVAVVTLSNADMLALRAAPIQVIAAPAAGKSIVVLRVASKCDATAGVYTESDDNIVLEYGDGTDIVEIETTGFIDQAGAAQYRTQAPVATVTTPVPASKLQLKNNGDGEFGGGNAANTLKVSVAYLVLG